MKDASSKAQALIRAEAMILDIERRMQSAVLDIELHFKLQNSLLLWMEFQARLEGTYAPERVSLESDDDVSNLFRSMDDD